MQQVLLYITVNGPWDLTFAQLFESADISEDRIAELIEYFHIDGNANVGEVLFWGDDATLISTAYANTPYNFKDSPLSEIASYLSLPGAQAFFVKWHRQSPLAVMKNGKLVATRTYPTVRTKDVSALARLFSAVDFNRNRFVLWPQPLKEAVALHMTSKKRAAISSLMGIPSLKALAHGRLEAATLQKLPPQLNNFKKTYIEFV